MMSRSFWSSLWLAPAILGATAFAAAAEPVQNSQPSTSNSVQLEQISDYTDSEEFAPLAGQVTSVSQLSDVRPTDWAFQALQSLVERYGCIVGYPDRTFRGNSTLSRYEFAAGVNACMDRINELIAASTADLVKKEDLLALQKLQEEFAAELATLRGQVDALEARTATLERQQFSTTTKLNGEVIFAISDVFGDQGAGGNDLPDELILTNRVRLNFDTSFSGKDRLRTKLEAINVTPYARGGNGDTGTNMTRLGFDGDGDNSLGIDELWYRFPLNNNLTVQVDAFGGEFQDGIIYTFNPLFQSSGTGSISRFGRFNPIYRLPGDDAAGVSFRYKFADQVSFEAGYLAGGNAGGTSNPANPEEKNGLFDGGFAALAQLVFRPTTNWDLGLTYARSYFPSGAVNLSRSTGSELSRRPFSNGVATSGNHFSAQSVYRFSPQFTLAGWFGYTRAEAQDDILLLVDDGDNANIINWGVALGFSDLAKEGSLLGLIVGQQPRVIDNDSAFGDEDDANWHLEAMFRYPVNDNIDITPGVLVILNPENNDGNDTIVVGTVRATFKF
jgi:hypothetical protein